MRFIPMFLTSFHMLKLPPSWAFIDSKKLYIVGKQDNIHGKSLTICTTIKSIMNSIRRHGRLSSESDVTFGSPWESHAWYTLHFSALDSLSEMPSLQKTS